MISYALGRLIGKLTIRAYNHHLEGLGHMLNKIENWFYTRLRW